MENKNQKLCEICGNVATSLCFKCISYFCEECYKYVHDKKINSQHRKEKIDYFVPYDTKCPQHPKIPITLFCIDEKGNKILYLFIII